MQQVSLLRHTPVWSLFLLQTFFKLYFWFKCEWFWNFKKIPSLFFSVFFLELPGDVSFFCSKFLENYLCLATFHTFSVQICGVWFFKRYSNPMVLQLHDGYKFASEFFVVLNGSHFLNSGIFSCFTHGIHRSELN